MQYHMLSLCSGTVGFDWLNEYATTCCLFLFLLLIEDFPLDSHILKLLYSYSSTPTSAVF